MTASWSALRPLVLLVSSPVPRAVAETLEFAGFHVAHATPADAPARITALEPDVIVVDAAAAARGVGARLGRHARGRGIPLLALDGARAARGSGLPRLLALLRATVVTRRRRAA